MTTAGARVLVVEHESALRQLIRSYLRDDGLLVLEADNGLDALLLLRRGGVDLALIDAVLPEIDGLELISRVRRESPLPIILMSSRDDQRSLAAAFRAGADDYLVKPLALAALAARVHAQLGRAAGFAPGKTVLREGHVELDLATRRCLIEGAEIELTSREFDLLSALLRYAGRIHSRRQLLGLVWGSEDLPDKTVDVHIASLRRKLGPAITIATLRGVGYRLDPVESAT